MCLTAYACLCGNSHSKINQKVGRPTGEGGRKVSDNPGQTGEGGSENLDFGRTSFVNGPLSKSRAQREHFEDRWVCRLQTKQKTGINQEIKQ